MTAKAVVPLSMPAVPRSLWHSPVLYLFGGLAATLGLIAFALLILAWSYRKLSGQLGNSDATSERDLEASADNSTRDLKPPPIFEEKILVIMAGQVKPTYLATPIYSTASSFGSNTTCSTNTTDKSDETAEKSENDETLDLVQPSHMDNHETTVQVP